MMDGDGFVIRAACMVAVLMSVVVLMMIVGPPHQARAARVVTAMELCLMEPQCVVTPEDWERYQRALRRLGEYDE